MLFSDNLEGLEACLIILLAVVIVLVPLFILSCWDDQNCKKEIREGQQALADLQESMSETERSERLDALSKKKEDASEIINKGTLYPFRDLQALTLNYADSNEKLPLSEEEELEEEAARYKNEHFRPTR